MFQKVVFQNLIIFRYRQILCPVGWYKCNAYTLGSACQYHKQSFYVTVAEQTLIKKW
jgi:hypothetical protein